ncbi:hypothetical protein OUZ56_032674, partial [Daphnia magna]
GDEPLLPFVGGDLLGPFAANRLKIAVTAAVFAGRARQKAFAEGAINGACDGSEGGASPIVEGDEDARKIACVGAVVEFSAGDGGTARTENFLQNKRIDDRNERAVRSSLDEVDGASREQDRGTRAISRDLYRFYDASRIPSRFLGEAEREFEVEGLGRVGDLRIEPHLQIADHFVQHVVPDHREERSPKGPSIRLFFSENLQERLKMRRPLVPLQREFSTIAKRKRTSWTSVPRTSGSMTSRTERSSGGERRKIAERARGEVLEGRRRERSCGELVFGEGGDAGSPRVDEAVGQRPFAEGPMGAHPERAIDGCAVKTVPEHIAKRAGLRGRGGRRSEGGGELGEDEFVAIGGIGRVFRRRPRERLAMGLLGGAKLVEQGGPVEGRKEWAATVVNARIREGQLVARCSDDAQKGAPLSILIAAFSRKRIDLLFLGKAAFGEADDEEMGEGAGAERLGIADENAGAALGNHIFFLHKAPTKTSREALGGGFRFGKLNLGGERIEDRPRLRERTPDNATPPPVPATPESRGSLRRPTGHFHWGPSVRDRQQSLTDASRDGGPTSTGARPFATASKFADGRVARDGGPTSTGARPFATASKFADGRVARDGGPTSTGLWERAREVGEEGGAPDEPLCRTKEIAERDLRGRGGCKRGSAARNEGFDTRKIKPAQEIDKCERTEKRTSRRRDKHRRRRQSGTPKGRGKRACDRGLAGRRRRFPEVKRHV